MHLGRQCVLIVSNWEGLSNSVEFVACSGGGPSTTIMLRGLAVLQNGKHWTGGERSLDEQVCRF